MQQGDTYYAQAGAKFIQAREAAGGYTLEYKVALRKCGVAERTEQRAIQFAKDPGAMVVHRKKDAIAAKSRRDRPTSDGASPNHVKDLTPKPLPSSFGEIHEAVQGWKAATARWRKCRRADKPKEALDWLTVALQHFKFIVERSNLPVVTGLSPDEIIEHLKF